ncbi:MAG TPA: FAD-dependent monooxygenase, partial [Thermoanaerobaculia bacterium]|nr:FAD-dependent monooxygenase [Thermoanaerobaculia bacterium]
IAARREGLAVRVVDKAPGPPIDKACGEGLMPDGVAALERLGVDVEALRGAPFRGIRYVDGAVAAEADFPGRPGLGVRRTRLHDALVERARAAGVEVEWGVRVVGIEGEAPEGGGRCRRERATRWSVRTAEGERLEAAAVVGADGLRSRMRRWAGLATDDASGDGEEPGRSGRFGSVADSERSTKPEDDRREPRSEPAAADRARSADPILAERPAPAADPAARFGVRRHYRVPAAELPPRVEVWWGDRCEAYVTPVGPEEVGVAMLWSGRKAGFDALLAGLPALARRFVGRPVVSDDRGAGPLLQPARAVVRGNLALVGDAGGYVDAITGEGLSLAFHQAEALVAAVAAGDLAAYARAHRRLGRVPNALTRLLVAVERRPALRRRAVRALAADPTLFTQLLAVHARQRPARALFPAGAARLAWRLATAAE